MPRKTKTSQQPVWLLSIDPAEAAGWCLFKDGAPKLWGPADGSTWKGLMKELYPVQSLLHETSLAPVQTRECVIEDGFFQYGKQTFKGTLTLGRRRGLAQAAGEAVGIDKFTYIGPSTWQNGLGYRYEAGRTTKDWSAAYVKSRWDIGDITHDVADAIALGTYYLDNYQELS